ncbi:hypothetical protein [Pedobacter sp. Hv1]|uniref:hypothetical protein n=1 Tax=Pedobacter sp. Hv1 TaxID=1740090 RepID=UPI000A427C49|nr:hypothetical protein [Pedobacter sp. Hv1]
MTEDKILLTARYVEGDMDEAENADFEMRMQSDTELQEHLKDYKHVHQRLKIQLAPDQQDIAFKETLKHTGAQYFAAPKVVSFKTNLKWLSGVAAVLIIGLLVWAPWRSNLYQTYHIDAQMLVTERGAEKITDLDKAAVLFNDQKYVEAQNLLAKLVQQQPENAMIHYYYGLSLIEINKLVEARSILTPVYGNESVFKYDAAYAIAMSYLKEDQKSDCKIWLQKIPEGTTHYQKAIELLGKLK